jgi:hypothetical protein
MRETAQLTEELAERICLVKPEITDGTEIELDDAINAITEFIIRNGNDEVRAFHFGLPIVQGMVDKANAYNILHPANKIIGFRFYRGVTSRIMDDGLEIEMKEDLVVFPTLANDNNHFEPIISHSRPCPKLCDRLPLGPLH